MALVAAIGLGGCQKKTAGPSVADYQKQREAAIARARASEGAPAASGTAGAPGEAADASFSANEVAFVYDPLGKRDPFRSFILDRVKERDEKTKSPLEQFDLSQLVVSGVVWETDQRRALILDPSGQNYIVQEGDPVGKNDGRIISIGDSEVVVREAYVDFHGEKTTKEIEMRVRQSQGG